MGGTGPVRHRMGEETGERPSASERARWLMSGAAMSVGCECAPCVGLKRGSALG